MSSPPHPSPSNDRNAAVAPLRRRKTVLLVVTSALVISAILILVLPLRIPFPLRMVVAGTDLLAAVVVALYLRQISRP